MSLQGFLTGNHAGNVLIFQQTFLVNLPRINSAFPVWSQCPAAPAGSTRRGHKDEQSSKAFGEIAVLGSTAQEWLPDHPQTPKKKNPSGFLADPSTTGASLCPHQGLFASAQQLQAQHFWLPAAPKWLHPHPKKVWAQGWEALPSQGTGEAALLPGKVCKGTIPTWTHNQAGTFPQVFIQRQLPAPCWPFLKSPPQPCHPWVPPEHGEAAQGALE